MDLGFRLLVWYEVSPVFIGSKLTRGKLKPKPIVQLKVESVGRTNLPGA